MNRWRQIDIRRLQSGYPLEEQDTLSDSSDDESTISPYDSDESSSHSESETESVPESLLKLVKAQNPSIDKAKHLLSDLTAADISKSIEQKDTKGNRVIHYACAKALVPWVELLIDNKADLNVQGKDGQRPIHFAVKGEDKNVSQVTDKERVVELLGKEQVRADEKDDHDRTPLQLACGVKGQREVTRALLSHTQINVNQDATSRTGTSSLLNTALQNDQFENAMLLLKHGAIPLRKDRAPADTPLHIILRKRRVKYAFRFLYFCDQKGHDMKEILLARNANQQCVLHEAVKCGDNELVKYCMNHVSQSADRDHLLESKTKGESTLMHTVCKHGHHGIVQMLDKMCPELLDCQNKRRLTPLHSACSRNQAEVTTLICDLLHMRREDFHIGMEESGPEDPPSLLKYTAKKDAIDSLMVLLKRRKDQKTLIDLLKWISVERNLFKVLKALLNRSEEIKLNKGQDDMMELTRLCAKKGHTESFLELVAWDKDMINKADRDDGNCLIHLIAGKGHHQTTKAILNLKNPDVQTKTKNNKGQTALHVAIQEGHRMTSELILKTDKELAGIKDNDKMTPLMYACKTGNIYIVKKLLEMLKVEKEAEVEEGFPYDENGLNCLDHAIDNGHEMIAVALLDQDDWRSLMTHATSGGGTKTTPMRKLISSMPGVGKFVLDKCIEPEPKLSVQPSDDEDEPDSYVKIKVDFELLEDWFSEWMRDWKANTGDDQPDEPKNGDYIPMPELGQGSGDNDENKDGKASMPKGDPNVTSNFNNDGKLKPDAKIYVRDRLLRSENHPVHYMIENDESKKLLDHPVVRLMFRNKHKAFRLEYWPRFCLQLTLLVYLTLHSLIIPPPYYVKKHLSEGNYTWLADGEAKWKEDLDSNALVLFGSIGTWIILLLTVIYFFEFLQRKWVYRKPKSFSIVGWLSFIRELTLQILIILFVVPGFGDVYFGHGVTFKADWQWELGAYAVLLAWINFILFLQTAPFFGIYILMFIEVITTMVNFLLVAGVFICTFAVVFCILIINQTQYHTFWDSLAKSLTMLTGGIDFDTVFHPTDYLYQQSATEDFTNIVFYPNTTLVIFLIFLFSMPIVVMNLLTGLAVYDIDVIQKKAKIVKQTIEAEGILAVQNNMLPWVWKRSVLQHKTITVFKNVSSLTAICYKLNGYKDTHDYLVAFLEELGKKAGRVEYTKTTDVKIDNMMDRIDDVRNRLYLLSDETLDANTLHREAIRQVQDKLDKMCRGKVV